MTKNNEDLIKAQDILLGRVNQICTKFGLNNVMAELYTVLYLSNKPISLNDMVERLKISKGSISINIRALERYGAVRKIWVKGSRKDFYEAEPDIAKVIIDRVKSMAKSRLTEVDDMINAAYEALNSVASSNKEESESKEIFKERLDKLRGLQHKAQSVFNLFNSSLLGGALNTKGKKDKKEALVI